jgi:hypothetical protein
MECGYFSSVFDKPPRHQECRLAERLFLMESIIDLKFLEDCGGGFASGIQHLAPWWLMNAFRAWRRISLEYE